MEIKILNKPKNFWYTLFSFSANPIAAGYSLNDEYHYEVIELEGEIYLRTFIDDVSFKQKIDEFDVDTGMIKVKGKEYQFKVIK